MNLTVHDIILRPVITEHAARMTERHNKYTFRVHRQANKVQIRRAIEELFSVKVKQVHTMNVPSKRKGGLRTRRPGATAAWKKAIVTLVEGNTIDLV